MGQAGNHNKPSFKIKAPSSFESSIDEDELSSDTLTISSDSHFSDAYQIPSSDRESDDKIQENCSNHGLTILKKNSSTNGSYVAGDESEMVNSSLMFCEENLEVPNFQQANSDLKQSSKDASQNFQECESDANGDGNCNEVSNDIIFAEIEHSLLLQPAVDNSGNDSLSDFNSQHELFEGNQYSTCVAEISGEVGSALPFRQNPETWDSFCSTPISNEVSRLFSFGVEIGVPFNHREQLFSSKYTSD